MKPQNLTPLVLAKLGFPHPIDYDVKPNGLLVVIDRSGRKYRLPKEDYEKLLDDFPPPLKVSNPHEGLPRGRKPKPN